MNTIISVAELVKVANTIKALGQFFTIYYDTDLKSTYNKLPIGMSATKANKALYAIEPTEYHKEAMLQAHYGSDYEVAMAKALGLASYDAEDPNSVHIVPNVLKTLKSTNKVYFIAMPSTQKVVRITHYGNALTEAEVESLKPYKKVMKGEPLPYRMIGVEKITKLVVNNQEYKVAITDSHYTL